MQVILKPLYHKGVECIGIYFEKNEALQSLIKKKASGRWSQTNKCWYVPCTGESYLSLKAALENKAELEITELKKFLLEKRKTNAEPTLSDNNKNIARFEKKGAVKVANFSKGLMYEIENEKGPVKVIT
jgi:hypothetical protein